MQDKLYELLMKDDEITWQSIILGLVKSEEMDPWDVDVSLLTKRYIETVKQLKETNFFISGKMVLASAILVKIKSNKLVEEEIARLDNALFPPEEGLDDLDAFAEFKERPKFDALPLAIKTPQARKKKVTVHDLISALERALEVNKRRILKRNAWWNFNKPTIPEKPVDIFQLIETLFERIKSLFHKKEKITYTKLLPETGNLSKKDKILTLYPLLYLETQNRINLTQQEHFGEIEIEVTS
ncbi:segregation/condensation protein A [Candidatus Woesearchaeota archaeon]|nr:segregation/condensation protein A [Candidatus Woesearchaeota archaeon]